MADTKITALTAITTVDPAVDVLPIVDISDTTMAASGTTKKITTNQILGSGGTATLASATISGDLTVNTNVLKVDTTNDRVGIVQATPLYPLHLVGEFGLDETSAGNGSRLRLIGDASKYNFRLGKQITVSNAFEITPSTAAGGTTFSNPVYTVTYDGIHTFLDGAGGTRMTLNSTGLGVGVSPSYRLDATDNTTNIQLRLSSSNNNGTSLRFVNTGTSGRSWQIGTGFAVTAGNFEIYDVTAAANRFTIDSTGNVGIGVTPSAWGVNTKAMQLGDYAAIFSNTANGSANISMNASFDGTNWKYKNSNWPANYYSQINGQHQWWNAPSSGAGGAGTTATFTQAMTLDASGRLLVARTGAGLDNTSGVTIGQASIGMQSEGNATQIVVNRTTSDGTIVDLRRNNSSVGNISVTTSGATFNSTSDYRLKESVAPLSGGLARVNALKPSIYKWKSDGSDGEGFLAHELAEVVPAAVTGEKDAVNEDGSIKAQSIDMSRIVPILVAAIKELSAEVNALKNA